VQHYSAVTSAFGSILRGATDQKANDWRVQLLGCKLIGVRLHLSL